MYYKKKNVNKVLIVIVAIVSVFLLAIIGIVISLSLKTKPAEGVKITGKNLELIEPTVKISKDIKDGEKDLDKVTLNIEAKTEDAQGIEYIEDDTRKKEYSDKMTVTITKNGIYTFTVKGKNGKIKKGKIEVKEIRVATSDKPYIPEGFKHVEGTEVATGYTIEDKNKNQFVWIPVPSGDLSSEMNVTNEFRDIEDGVFNNSVLVNKGFYISKYEASNNSNVAASLKGKKPWTDVSFEEARKLAKDMAKMNEYKDMDTSLPTSKAWVTTLEWLDKTQKGYSQSREYGNYASNILPTGEKSSDEINGICDLAGNVREWTLEKYDNKNVEKAEEITEKMVLRGGAAGNTNTTPESKTVADIDSTGSYWGFRVILYKSINSEQE